MKLKGVTITGADDSTEAGHLVEMSLEWAFVEWGVLVSQTRRGAPRFPSLEWIVRTFDAFGADVDSLGPNAPLSMHLCGKYVSKLLVGIQEVPAALVSGFSRVQLNFGRAPRAGFHPRPFARMLEAFGPRQIIFQLDGVCGRAYLAETRIEDARRLLNLAPLHDASGGDGITPPTWPEPLDSYAWNGYAGGLGPGNIREELERLEEVVGDCEVWVDMESRVRSEDGKTLDIAAVDKVLVECARFIGERQ